MQDLHITQTGKKLPLLYYSDPQVYDALGNNNDIYGNTSILNITFINQKVPYLIMEGVYDTLDGILSLEKYKNYLVMQNSTTSSQNCNWVRYNWNLTDPDLN
jgi:hypothetical protein